MPRESAPSRRALSSDGSSRRNNLSRRKLFTEYSNIRDMFMFCDTVGTGACGVVKRCSDLYTGEVFACKTILKSSLRCQLDIDDLRSEVDALRFLGKLPFVVSLVDVLEDASAVHLMMELCEGGDLFSRIKKKKFYSEREAATVCKSVASVLDYAHTHGIMHRDIKPENILLVSEDSDTDIRLADFGSSTFFRQGQRLNQLIGSPLYISPSVLRHDYGPEADLWSLGVVLYILLCGVPPFWGRNNPEIFHSIQSTPLDLNRGRLRFASPEAKNLISSLLRRGPGTSYMTAAEVLEHPFITQNTPSGSETQDLEKPRISRAISVQPRNLPVGYNLTPQDSAHGHRHSLGAFRAEDLFEAAGENELGDDAVSRNRQKSVWQRAPTLFSESESKAESEGSGEDERRKRMKEEAMDLVTPLPVLSRRGDRLSLERRSEPPQEPLSDDEEDVPVARAFMPKR